MKILLIEDGKQLANSIQSYLSGNDFIFEWVSNIHLALDKISVYEYDCVLLDLIVSDGNGFGILNNLKKMI
ncbi:response regulator [Flavobacterium cellulosilyticum]|uniref:Response regulator n=1 Tax=Flavobacterium cellulosilyticum TaxID=2541731 RepID=A0A4V2Z084_9FLAO|nr:response regulator [Flavobacterium cellulosilyticum]TDD99567.1 response regulator [Flavobacterium cellulosilyticum]